MSADLWSAFAAGEDDNKNPWAQSEQASSGIVKISSTTNVPAQSIPRLPQNEVLWEAPILRQKDISSHAEEDPWGDFEKGQSQWAYVQPAIKSPDPWAQLGASPISEVQKSQLGRGALQGSEDEDFGDFEEPETEVQATLQSMSISPKPPLPLTAVADHVQKKGPQMARPSPSEQVSDPFGGLDQLGAPKPKPVAPLKDVKAIRPPDYKPRHSHQTSLIEEIVPYSTDEWGEFSPDPVRTPTFTTSSSSKTTRHEQPAKPKAGPTKLTKAPRHMLPVPTTEQESPVSKAPIRAPPAKKVEAPTSLPPSNVPPPSILMALLASLIQKLPAHIEATKGSPAVSKNADNVLGVLEALEEEEALQRSAGMLRVAGRVLAGRKLRWKRDPHLAQSMSIGQAGRSGGMKLVGVDKTELKREEREAAEVARIWKQNLGSIRGALASVKVEGKPLSLPEIVAAPAVRTLKQAEGGIPSPKGCVVCGIKRDERVSKVDVDVYDAFGEWWIDFWGHSDCKLFWEEHQTDLQQR